MSRQTVQQARGYTLVEVLATVAIGGALVLGLSGVVGTALDTHHVVAGTAEANRSANEAMARMVSAVSQTRRLLLPLADVSATNWPEHIREQTVPASPPVGTSVLATAVLAVSLPATVDLDNDGVPDADNDNDGRLDEDPGAAALAAA